MSDLAKNPMILAGGGALVGLVIGMLIGNAVTDRKIADGIGQAMAEFERVHTDTSAQATAAVSEQIAALETVVADSQAELVGLTNDLGSQIKAGTDALSAKIEAGTSGVRTEIKGAAKGQSAALALLSAKVANVSSRSQVTGSSQTAESETETVATSEAAADAGFGIGETAVFADGNVRVFVSRLDVADRSARLSVNAQDMHVTAGHATVVRHAGGTCLVGVSAISSSGAVITSDCDTPLAGPTFSAGETAILEDGALRVFVSGILSGDARLAINGLDTQTVSVGDVLEVVSGDQTCTVSVSGIRDGSLALNGVCS